MRALIGTLIGGELMSVQSNYSLRLSGLGLTDGGRLTDKKT